MLSQRFQSLLSWAMMWCGRATSVPVWLALIGTMGWTSTSQATHYLVNALVVSGQRGAIKPGLDDHQYFPARRVAAGAPQPWRKHARYNEPPLSSRTLKVLQDTEAAAFLVVKDGQLLQEHYFRGHDSRAISNSFSMAKPVVAMLAAFAVSEGKIASLQEPVGRFLPGYETGPGARLKIIDLITMKSGMQWDDPEVYNEPFSRTTRLYYEDDLSRFIGPMPITREPGSRFHYNSANTLLLARVVRQATGRTISDYLSEKLWVPLGMERDASWMLDRQGGEEKAYCCLSATARDFARLGQFVLQMGAWNGKQVLSREYLVEGLKPNSPNYGYGFRMDEVHQPKIYMFRGINGQLVIMLPQFNAVIVKLGRTALPDDPKMPLERAPETYLLVDEVVQMLAKL